MDAELADVVRRVLADTGGTAHLREAYGEPRGADDRAWKALASTGVTGLLVPGSGAGMTEVGAVCAELGAVCSALPFSSSAVAAVSVLAAGDDPQGWLDRLADGTAVGTVALLEPDRRWDLSAPATQADSGGRLTGTKVHVPDAGAADLLLVGAADGVYAVEAAAASITAEPAVDGSRPQSRVDLRDSPGARIAGPEVLAPVLDRVVAAAVSDGVGSARAALRLALDYARTREQFGVPIGTFQSVQHLLVDAFQAIELTAVAVENALAVLDDAGASAAERHRAVVVAHAQAADALPAATAAALQVFGGVGFTWEHDVGLHHKRALSLTASHSDSSTALSALADLVL
jgi:alkylation response protein AidB-like acyl-CoA dehydrogenase